MRDLEAEMAKALDGKFFWEHTSLEEPITAGESYEIRCAQKQFAQPKVKITTEDSSDKINRIKAVVIEYKPKLELVRQANSYKRSINKMLEVVSALYEMPTDRIISRERDYGSHAARHHFVWAIFRYFPQLHLAEVARVIDKNHSTAYNSRLQFDKIKDRHSQEVAALDIIMGHI